MDLWPYLLVGCPVGITVRVRDVSDEPFVLGGVGRIQQWGGLQADREATLAREGWSGSIPPSGGRVGGVIISGGRGLRLSLLEHVRTVYCDQAHYVPVTGGGLEAGSKGVQVVVGTGRI